LENNWDKVQIRSPKEEGFFLGPNKSAFQERKNNGGGGEREQARFVAPLKKKGECPGKVLEQENILKIITSLAKR